MVREAKKRISAELTVPTVSELDVPKEAYGFILGKNGNRLRELEQRTGAKISLPKGDSTDTIKIKGSRDAIETAIHEIQIITADALSKCKEVISIEKEYHAFISGPFNETLTQLQTETGARISIPPYSVSVVVGKHSVLTSDEPTGLQTSSTNLSLSLSSHSLPIYTSPIKTK